MVERALGTQEYILFELFPPQRMQVAVDCNHDETLGGTVSRADGQRFGA